MLKIKSILTRWSLSVIYCVVVVHTFLYLQRY